MELAPATRADLGPLTDLWNAYLGSSHPLRLRLLQQHWDHPHFDSSLAWVIRERGEVLGAIAGKAPEIAWHHQGVGYLSYLMVAPHHRQRGLGKRLLTTLLAALRARGCREVRIGSDPGHLLPGIPTAVPLESWAFLRHHGFHFGAAEHDLHLDLRQPLPSVGVAPGFTVSPGQADAVLSFLARVFPGRWHEEVAHYLGAGTTLLALTRDDDDVVLGFAAVFTPEQPLIGPSQYWSPALGGAVAGLGPMGIDPSLRGQGQGLALFVAAARWLKEQGAEHLLIDWTTLTDFYGRAGAHVWRSYQRAALRLDAA